MANPDLQIKGCPVIQSQTGIEISGGGGGLTKNFFGYLGLNLIKDRGGGGGGGGGWIPQAPPLDPPLPSPLKIGYQIS